MQPQLPALAELAQRLASVYLADWFRLDVFVGHPRLGMRVNEVTYPSHVRDIRARCATGCGSTARCACAPPRGATFSRGYSEYLASTMRLLC